MTRILTLLAASAAVAFGPASAAEQSNLVELAGASVESVVKPLAYSGVLATYTEIRVKYGEEHLSLFHPYFNDDPLPQVGAECTFHIEARKINGFAGEHALNGVEVLLVRSFRC